MLRTDNENLGRENTFPVKYYWTIRRRGKGTGKFPQDEKPLDGFLFFSTEETDRSEVALHTSAAKL